MYIENRIEEKQIEKTEKKNRLKRLVFLKVEKMGNYNVANKKQQPICETRIRRELEKRKVQAKKSARRMPWHWEPKKDATSCEKLRGAANKL